MRVLPNRKLKAEELKPPTNFDPMCLVVNQMSLPKRNALNNHTIAFQTPSVGLAVSVWAKELRAFEPRPGRN
jgi:hypothetical protein